MVSDFRSFEIKLYATCISIFLCLLLSLPPRSYTRCIGNSTLETLFLEKNYWRATKTGREIFDCPIDNSCKGGSEFSNGGESYCSKGHQGVLCAVCDNEYFFDNEQNTCSKCDDAFKSQSLWTALLVLLLIFAAYMAWKKSLKDETRKVLLKVFRKTKQKINTLAIMLQIATAISVNLSISFPIDFTKFLGAFNMLNLNPFQVVAFGCMGEFNVSFFIDAYFQTQTRSSILWQDFTPAMPFPLSSRLVLR